MSVAGTKNFDQPPHDSNRTHLVFSTSGLLLGSRAPLVLNHPGGVGTKNMKNAGVLFQGWVLFLVGRSFLVAILFKKRFSGQGLLSHIISVHFPHPRMMSQTFCSYQEIPKIYFTFQDCILSGVGTLPETNSQFALKIPMVGR